MWLIFSVVLSMQLRDSLCQRMGRLCLDGRMEQTTFLCLSGALHGCMMALQALILAVNLPVQLSVPMMIGYLLCGMAAFYSTYAAYEERAVLRRAYIDSVVGDLRQQLDNTYIVDAKGNKRKLRQ